MSEKEPTLRDVLGAVQELRGEMGEVRVGLGDVRGRLDRVETKVSANGEVIVALREDLETHGRETRRQFAEFRGDLVAELVKAVERTTYATELRILRAKVERLEHDVAELKRAAGE